MCEPTFSSWGCGGGGAVSPPAGSGSRAPEANAFWQKSVENELKIRSHFGRQAVHAARDCEKLVGIWMLDIENDS